jgi:hypothetical protein
MGSGYRDCVCCSEIIVVDDDTVPQLCDECGEAGCEEDGSDCCRGLDETEEGEPCKT